jgi:hypothetical protein
MSWNSYRRKTVAFVVQTTLWFFCLAAIAFALLLSSADVQSFRYVGF